MSVAEKSKVFEDAEIPWPRIFITGLRILIGWHFLYEGVAKLFIKNWTSAGYLLQSHWFLSGFFHWITRNPVAQLVVDQMNIWGLILVGLGLLFGCLTRAASAGGILLILLYYIANPPFIGFVGESTGEGHYLVVNKNLIEMVLLLLFMFLPKKSFFGLDRWFSRRHFKTEVAVSPDKGEKSKWRADFRRRELLKDLIGLPFFGGFFLAAFQKQKWESFEERHLVSQPSRTEAVSGASPRGAAFASLKDLKGRIPNGKIKHLDVSRLICGGNLISGIAHSRDLMYVSPLVQAYFSDEKVLETLQVCETCGINTMIIRVDTNTIRIIEKYRRRGGKMQWFAQAKATEKDLRSDIDAAVDNGAVAVYIHGGVCDLFVKKGQVNLLAQALEYIQKKGVLSGFGAHAIQVPIACEKARLNPDFYMKTLNSANYWTAGPRIPKAPNWKPDPKKTVEPEYMADRHDNIWEVTPLQTVAHMKGIARPWIAYKVLGAGAISPKEGFRYAFENGADFICVGMFDFHVVEDANLVLDLFAKGLKRERPWQG